MATTPPKPSDSAPRAGPQSLPGPVEPSVGASPYATGGGGFTFERKVAVVYLARLLTGEGCAELEPGRQVATIGFQQAPKEAVDDIVISAQRPGEAAPSLVLALAVRRAPQFVQSDNDTKNLVRSLVSSIRSAPQGGPEHRVGLVVAGSQPHAKELATLADLAAHQMSAAAFFDLLATPQKFDAALRTRLAHLENLVTHALADLEPGAQGPGAARQQTWELLSRLSVVMPRLEVPDESDWAATLNALVAVARGHDIAGASLLRDRLLAHASEYPVKAATIGLARLRRDVHALLDSSVVRLKAGRDALGHLHERSLAAIRTDIAVDATRRFHVERPGLATAILATAEAGGASLVHGESGVGKSALVLEAAARKRDDALQTICVNLRHLPRTSLELRSILGARLAEVLEEMSAPRRVLVVDGADAAAEGWDEQLGYLVEAARESAVGIVAIAAADGKVQVQAALTARFDKVDEHVVPLLSDTELDQAVAAFGELTNLAHDARSRQLLRRLVVVDLLVRAGVSGVPLSDAEAMQQVWTGLVARQGQSDRGTTHARQFTMLRLARFELEGGDPLELGAQVDAAALEGLRRDGLLRTSVDDPYRIAPEFAHDEVRRYAIARLLLSDRLDSDVTTRLRTAGAPRWALASARLACQAALAAPSTIANPGAGRFRRLQAQFDAIADAGHGDRWRDVPGEALLTLGDPAPTLRDAWEQLREDDNRGLQHLCRLVDQRLRDDRGFVRVGAVEPIVDLLLEDEELWSRDELHDVVRDWLRSLVVAETSEGHPLRTRLRDGILRVCERADARVEAERVAEAARLAARSPEQAASDRARIGRNEAVFYILSGTRHRGRPSRAVPYEIRNEATVELLALLGPDIGADGEAVLRRLAADDPESLTPAVEALLAGQALALRSVALLQEVAEAYYINRWEDGSRFHEDGVRDHHRSRAFGPLAAWHYGPFMPLLQANFRLGVALVNRMLNHAALARARTLARLDVARGQPVSDADVARYRVELDVAGEPRVFVGDDHVWRWYRGSGVGPYPCMSALQALERVCDRLVAAGVPLSKIASVLLNGCQNLGTVGLLLGVLVRHAKASAGMLDPYLGEPTVWNLEFSRAGAEMAGLKAPSDGVAEPGRRKWSLREVAAYLVVTADESRTAELRAVGGRLVARAREQLVAQIPADVPNRPAIIEDALVTVRGWASSLDRDNYQAEQKEDGVHVVATPPADVRKALEDRNAGLRRAQEATRLIVRYGPPAKATTSMPVSAEELAADLRVARDLLLTTGADGAADVDLGGPTAAAASALAAYVVDGLVLPADLLRFAADVVLDVATATVPTESHAFADSYFELGADRSAARVLPALLLPAGAAVLTGEDLGAEPLQREDVVAGCKRMARSASHEVRLHLARGLDCVWRAPCVGRDCHHTIGMDVLIESLRDCALGRGVPSSSSGLRESVLGDPVELTVAELSDDDVHIAGLDAAIRALPGAASTATCVAGRARSLLTVLLRAQRRALVACEGDLDNRGTHALAAARALLSMASRQDDALLFEHLDALSTRLRHLDRFLRALAGAAEESPLLGAAARRLWPSIVERVLAQAERPGRFFEDDREGGWTLAAVLPNPTGEVAYLYRELHGDPVPWWRPSDLRSVIDRWVPLAAGRPTCVDQYLSFLSVLGADAQARDGIGRVEKLVLPNPAAVARGSHAIAPWLIEVRAPARVAGLEAAWQRIVDALVVAGLDQLAPYSE